MPKKITWLHLSDFHVGNVHTRNKIDKILSMLEKDRFELCKDEFEKLEFIIISGDIANKGHTDHFNEFKSKVLRKLDKLTGNNLPFFFVPGNHDLKRPTNLSNLEFLSEYNDENSEIANNFRVQLWSEMNQKPLEPIRVMFKNYSNFLNSIRKKYIYDRGVKKENMKLGLMPGDFYCTFSPKGKGIRLGLIGLNSTWRQYKKGDFLGKVSVDSHQLEYLLAGKITDLSKNHANILIQHHPEHWLDPADNWRKLVVGEKNCDIVLCGHVHEPKSEVSSPGSMPGIKILTAKSFCGLKYYGEKKEKREFGYTIGTLTYDSSKTENTHHMRTHISGHDIFSDDPEGLPGAEPWVIKRTRSPKIGRTAAKRAKASREPTGNVILNDLSLKKHISDIDLEPKAGYVSILYRLLLWLRSRDSKSPILDRAQIFISFAALEYVVSILQQETHTPKDELFAQVLLSYPLEEYKPRALDDVFTAAETIYPRTEGVRSKLMSLIRDFVNKENRQLLGKEVLIFYRTVFTKRPKEGQNPVLSLLCAGLAVGAATQIGDERDRLDLFDTIHEELSNQDVLLAYHIRGFAFSIANMHEEALQQWNKVLVSAAQAVSASDKHTELIQWARKQVFDSANINLKLLPFQLALKDELHEEMIRKLGDCTTDGIGVNWADQFVRWCLDNEETVITSLNETIGSLRDPQRDRLLRASRSLLEVTMPEDFGNYHKKSTFVMLVRRHNIHANYISGHLKDISKQNKLWKPYDLDQYKDCVTNQLWSPELIWLDMAVSDYMRTN